MENGNYLINMHKEGHASIEGIRGMLKLGPCPSCGDHLKPCKCELNDRIDSLEQAVELLLEASAPYLKRKKMTKRSYCNLLNKCHSVATEILRR